MDELNRCECGCGTPVEHRFVWGHNVRLDPAARNLRHGMTGSPEYKAWLGMRFRCLNPNGPNYHNYGGRGINVCAEWLDDFEAFYDHVGPRPSPEHSLDRIDNDGDYEPGNVRWATRQDQIQNRRMMSVCKRGHELVGDNVYDDPSGIRACRACRALRKERYNASRKTKSCACGCGGLTGGTWVPGHNTNKHRPMGGAS